MVRFMSPAVVTNECERVWRGAMFATILVPALAALPAVAAGFPIIAAIASGVAALTGGIAVGASLVSLRFEQ